jgi:ubiquinone/menaquinone biosynthesis C-methylase UbiE
VNSTDSTTSGAAPFAAVAPFYDLDLEGYEDDLFLYRQLAAEAGGAVLELGCGTGRVARALADAGVEVVGVDLSAPMLAIARERLAGSDATLHEADFRSLNLRRRFPLVLVPLGGLQHMATVDDVVAALQSASRHVTAEGRVVVDVEAPNADDFTAGPQPLMEHWTREWHGGGVPSEVTKLVSVVAHPTEGLREVTWHFDVQPEDGPLRRTTAQFELRTITLGELELGGQLAGLAVSGAWGDYDFSPADDGAARLVVAFVQAEVGEVDSVEGSVT